MITQVIISKKIPFKKINSIISKKKKNFQSLNMNLENSEEEKQVMIPGKIILSKSIIEEREIKLKSLAEKWKKERIIKENNDNKTFGFTLNSEILNGRVAMFFIVTGLLTEIWTKETIPGQIETILRTFGII
mmetsp:Transcript_30282/g.59140  ORF Transcript_30282/g.59140 Transcript_30282/m.59140 type:complete len:132 (+) Transcript_30282:135-530(+)